MFNETSFSGFGAIDTTACAALKLNCDTRFPISEDPQVQADLLAGKVRDLNWECMQSTGYVSQCMQNKSYDNPGATKYPWDVLTNPDNPNTVWQWPQFILDLAASLGVAPWMLAAGGGLVLLVVVGGFAGRR